jgi:hypothetical protein
MPSSWALPSFEQPWAPAFYAQRPIYRRHIWSLDIEGVHVVVQSGEFAETSPEDLAEMYAIVESPSRFTLTRRGAHGWRLNASPILGRAPT